MGAFTRQRERDRAADPGRRTGYQRLLVTNNDHDGQWPRRVHRPCSNKLPRNAKDEPCARGWETDIIYERFRLGTSPDLTKSRRYLSAALISIAKPTGWA